MGRWVKWWENGIKIEMVLENNPKNLEENLKQRGVGNSNPIGLFAFGTTQLIYSLYLIQIANITNNQVGLGSALFYGGIIQVLSGIYGLFSGKTLSGFWISFGFIYLPSSGIIDSFKDDQVMLRNAIGIYLTVWAIFTFLMLIASLKTTILEISTITFALTVFIFLTLANFTGLNVFSRIAGYFGGKNF
ncbi:11287_t:CDS:2 [Dentiscutata heterogama]|uniref:11287_t:CDS:1 n=1 Tax=Dentiscutata heterogama TaxID=1316150 RepID=A0ACA9KIC1_9GLOM|nr:11287_t:CDS:2 [Dentiscutata heterogama]